MVAENRKKTMRIRFGRAKGKRLKNSIWPKISGYCSAGSAKRPPKLGPIIEPRLQTIGMMENALG
jgi:hypothetical protein